VNIDIKSSYPKRIGRFLIILFLSLFSFSCINVRPGAYNQSDGMVALEGNAVYRYLLYLPKDYARQPSRKWPLLVYLHGNSCRGYNLEKLKKYGPPYLVSAGWNFTFIIVSPQCPSDRNWDKDDWFPSLYNDLSGKYRIDEKRIYLTGMSLGGSGVWSLAMRHPEYFAAAIPLCGGWSTKNIKAMKDIPVWAFHGALDNIVPPRETEKLVDALRKAGGSVRYSKLAGQGHSIHKVYEEREIYEWLLRHKK
jgi:predicted peptidase